MEFPWGLFLFDKGTFLSYGAKSVKLSMEKTEKTRLNVVQ